MTKFDGVTWFNKLPRLIQFILLLIPIVSWVVEILVRWGTFIKTGGLVGLVVAIIYTIFGCIPIIGWIDLVWVLLFKKLFLQ